MPLQISPPTSETIAKIREAIERAIPDAEVQVAGEGGHFAIRVVSSQFAEKTTLAKQRMVYAAIGPLMKGESPPVHAIDRLETAVP